MRPYIPAIGMRFKCKSTGDNVWRRVTEQEACVTGKEKNRFICIKAQGAIYVTPSPATTYTERTYYTLYDWNGWVVVKSYKAVLKELL